MATQWVLHITIYRQENVTPAGHVHWLAQGRPARGAWEPQVPQEATALPPPRACSGGGMFAQPLSGADGGGSERAIRSFRGLSTMRSAPTINTQEGGGQRLQPRCRLPAGPSAGWVSAGSSRGPSGAYLKVLGPWDVSVPRRSSRMCYAPERKYYHCNYNSVYLIKLLTRPSPGEEAKKKKK